MPVVIVTPEQQAAAEIEWRKRRAGITAWRIPVSAMPQPQPGPQTEFSKLSEVDVNIVIYGGAAGGGKTVSLLAYPLIRRHVENPHFRAVYFRRSSPMITGTGGTWDAAIKLYPQTQAVMRVGDHVVKWPSGAQLQFSHLIDDNTVLNHQSSEYCCERTTLVRMGDGSLKQVQDIRVGDLVATLEGPRRVVKASDPHFAACVESKAFDERGNFIGSQIQSRNHRVMTPEGWRSYDDMCDESPLPCSSLSMESHCFQRSFLSLRQRFQTWLRSLFDRPMDQKRPYESFLLSLGRQFLLVCAEHTFRLFRGIYGESFLPKPLALGPSFEGRASATSQAPGLHRSAHGDGQRFRSSAVSNETFESLPQGYLDDYSVYYRRYGGQPHLALGRAQLDRWRLLDAAVRIPTYYVEDDPACTRTHNHGYRSQYVHPYTEEPRQTSQRLLVGSCVMSPVGDREVVSLTIADASHYITTNGTINANCGLYFDELTHFEESQFWYMLSRNRSTCGIQPYVRGGCNPAPGWVKQLLAPWVDRAFPNPAKAGEVRYFARVNDETVWVDEDWRHDTGDKPLSITFIRSSVYDNKILLENDPKYISNLLSLSQVNKQRLLYGDWEAAEGMYYDDFVRDGEGAHCVAPMFTPTNPPPAWYTFFAGVDPGFADPWFVQLAMMDEAGDVHLLECDTQPRLGESEQAQRTVQMAQRWGIPLSRLMVVAGEDLWAKRKVDAIEIDAPVEKYYKAGLTMVRASNDALSQYQRTQIVRSYLKAHRLWVYRGFNNPIIATLENARHDPLASRAELPIHDKYSHGAFALGCALGSWPEAPSRDRQMLREVMQLSAQDAQNYESGGKTIKPRTVQTIKQPVGMDIWETPKF